MIINLNFILLIYLIKIKHKIYIYILKFYYNLILKLELTLYVQAPILLNYRPSNHLGGSPVVKAWDQEVCSLCGLRFEPCGCSYDGHWRLIWSSCGCSYDGHWRLIWSLTSGRVGLVEVHASWPN